MHRGYFANLVSIHAAMSKPEIDMSYESTGSPAENRGPTGPHSGLRTPPADPLPTVLPPENSILLKY